MLVWQCVFLVLTTCSGGGAGLVLLAGASDRDHLYRQYSLLAHVQLAAWNFRPARPSTTCIHTCRYVDMYVDLS